MKVKSKVLFVSILLLFIIFLTGVSVKAVTVTEEYLQNMLDVLPKSFNINLNEIDFGEKAQAEVENQIKEIWKEQNIDTTGVELWMSSTGLENVHISVSYNNSIVKDADVSIIYKNSNVNNENDKKEIEKIVNAIPKNSQGEYEIIVYNELNESCNFEDVATKELQKLINGNSYEVVNAHEGYGGGGDALSIIGGGTYYIFKNEKYCGSIKYHIEERSKITVPDNIEDTETAYLEYVKSKLTGYMGHYDYVINNISKIEKISGYYYNVYCSANSESMGDWYDDLPEMVIIKKAEGALIGNNIYVDNLENGVEINVATVDNTELKKEAKNKGYQGIIGSYNLTVKENKKLNSSIDITFKVGTNYNDKTVYVIHQKNNGSNEEFEKVVKNGKVTITVNELSPFVLAVKETTNVQSTPPANKGEKDETPKTGYVDMIGYVSLISILSMAGIVLLKKMK